MLNMRSAGDDRATPAVIRDAALALFAAEGHGVSLRRIAAAAGVSPGLVLHHFGSKAGLVEAVDAHVLGVFDDLIGEFVDAPEPGDLVAMVEGGDDSSLRAYLDRVGPDSPIIDYLRRTLVEGGDGTRRLVRHWYEMTARFLEDYRARGFIDPGTDVPMRAAQLLAMDLGMIMLRPIMTELLGQDPLGDGTERWAAAGYELFSRMLTDAAHEAALPSEDPS